MRCPELIHRFEEAVRALRVGYPEIINDESEEMIQSLPNCEEKRNYLEAMKALIAMMEEEDYMDVHNQGYLVEKYGKSLWALKRLPACAACGIRALPSDASQYRKFRLKFLGILKYSENEKMQFLEKPIEYQKVKSVYKRQKHGSDECEYFHLHPELVERNEEVDDEECELCGQCWKDGVSDQ